MFEDTSGARSDTPKIVLVITDGMQSNKNKKSVYKQAAKLRQKGVLVFVIGIGGVVDVGKLREVVGDEQRMFLAASANALTDKKFVKKIAKVTCDAAGMYYLSYLFCKFPNTILIVYV